MPAAWPQKYAEVTTTDCKTIIRAAKARRPCCWLLFRFFVQAVLPGHTHSYWLLVTSPFLAKIATQTADTGFIWRMNCGNTGSGGFSGWRVEESRCRKIGRVRRRLVGIAKFERIPNGGTETGTMHSLLAFKSRIVVKIRSKNQHGLNSLLGC